MKNPYFDPCICASWGFLWRNLCVAYVQTKCSVFYLLPITSYVLWFPFKFLLSQTNFGQSSGWKTSVFLRYFNKHKKYSNKVCKSRQRLPDLIFKSNSSCICFLKPFPLRDPNRNNNLMTFFRQSLPSVIWLYVYIISFTIISFMETFIYLPSSFTYLI